MRLLYSFDRASSASPTVAFLFVGDSANDASMFAYFPLSVGVANACASGDRLPTPPGYVKLGSSGAGFVELVDRVTAARGESREA